MSVCDPRNGHSQLPNNVTLWFDIRDMDPWRIRSWHGRAT